MKLIPFSRYKTVGHSMEPTFHEGEVVWVYNWAYLFHKPRVGDLVIFDFENKDLLKKVVEVRNSAVLVAGENTADSLDSRQIGEISFQRVRGRIWSKNKQG